MSHRILAGAALACATAFTSGGTFCLIFAGACADALEPQELTTLGIVASFAYGGFFGLSVGSAIGFMADLRTAKPAALWCIASIAVGVFLGYVTFPFVIPRDLDDVLTRPFPAPTKAEP